MLKTLSRYLLVPMIAMMLAFAPLAVPSVHAGDWVPNYAATPSSPEMVKYVTSAWSKKGGNCCTWADGYQLGKAYEVNNNVTQQKAYRVVFLSWRAGDDGYYHAVVWDSHKGKYVELVADYEAFAPGNPTGTPIVWVRHNLGNFEIRCWGGEAQG